MRGWDVVEVDGRKCGACGTAMGAGERFLLITVTTTATLYRCEPCGRRLEDAIQSADAPPAAPRRRFARFGDSQVEPRCPTGRQDTTGR